MPKSSRVTELLAITSRLIGCLQQEMEAIRAMRNAILLGKILGSVDPELLAGAASAVSETFSNARSLPTRPPGLWATLRTFAGRDVRSIVGWMGIFAAKFASHLRTRKA